MSKIENSKSICTTVYNHIKKKTNTRVGIYNLVFLFQVKSLKDTYYEYSNR